MRFLSTRVVLAVFVVHASILRADEPREASVGQDRYPDWHAGGPARVRLESQPNKLRIKELGKLGPKAVPAVIDAMLRKRTIGPNASALDAVGKRGVDAGGEAK